MTPPLVRLENVDVALDGKPILRGVSWRLLPGQHWAILGPNGSGKSTLLRLIRGELGPAPGRGRRVYALDHRPQTTAVGVQEAIACVSPELQQRYLRQEWTRTARQAIESGFGGGDYAYRRLTATQVRRARTLARWLDVEPLLRRNVQELSTGELRRVLIARALAGAPRALVCDEICDGLDTVARGRLLERLDRVARNGTQLLFTTHRAEELVPALTHRLVMERGRIVECGKLDRPIQPGKRARDEPSEERGIDADSTSAGTGAMKRHPCRAPFSGVVARQDSGNSHAGFPAVEPRLLIRIRHADVYLGPRHVLRDVNWEMRAGEHWAVLGPNGAGKSTFLKLVLGDLHPAWGGQVTRFKFTAGDTIWELKRRIGYVSPDFQAAYSEDVTGADVIGSGFFSSVGRTRPLSARQRRCVAGVVRRLGLEPLAAANALRLSYGEFRKLLLARALVQEPDLLIFDEPFDGLDAASRQQMAATLEKVATRGTSLLVVTHHAADLPACTTHLARLTQGRLEFQGPVVNAH